VTCDFGAAFGQAVKIVNQPAIPVSDTDTPPNTTAPIPPKRGLPEASAQTPQAEPIATDAEQRPVPPGR
jgi:hypothetical protein